jgi:hypothetical protein
VADSGILLQNGHLVEVVVDNLAGKLDEEHLKNMSGEKTVVKSDI